MTHSTQPELTVPGSGQFLSSDSTVIQAPVSDARPDELLLRPGTIVGGFYEIGRLLGRGGMGQVFEARDRLLGRFVAIKVSWPHIGLDPLLREARALAALRTSSVPAVFGVGTHGELTYCVMERLYGHTLSAHMVRRFATGRFAVEEVLDIVIGVADALIAVHGAGLIHRDLKPSNIMLAPRNRFVLLDFGLFLTESGAGADAGICGSPRYIAPEVITASLRRGQAHLVDIYSIGVIAFMLLTAMAPFDDISATRILSKHVHSNPPPLALIRPDVPRPFVRWIDRMLAKDPDERAFSAEAIASGLRAVRDRVQA